LVDFLDTDYFNDYGAKLDIVLENRCGYDIDEAEIYLTNDIRISTCTLSLEEAFGFYTNGLPLEETIRIIISLTGGIFIE